MRTIFLSLGFAALLLGCSSAFSKGHGKDDDKAAKPGEKVALQSATFAVS
jgi:uncharacterized protein YceK